MQYATYVWNKCVRYRKDECPQKNGLNLALTNLFHLDRDSRGILKVAVIGMTL